jgi:hypothetical protein
MGGGADATPRPPYSPAYRQIENHNKLCCRYKNIGKNCSRRTVFCLSHFLLLLVFLYSSVKLFAIGYTWIVLDLIPCLRNKKQGSKSLNCGSVIGIQLPRRFIFSPRSRVRITMHLLSHIFVTQKLVCPKPCLEIIKETIIRLPMEAGRHNRWWLSHFRFKHKSQFYTEKRLFSALESRHFEFDILLQIALCFYTRNTIKLTNYTINLYSLYFLFMYLFEPYKTL